MMQASRLFLLAWSLVSAAASDKCQWQLFTDFAAALGPILSPGASINFPGSDKFANATSRSSAYGAPKFAIAVDVATEDDVANTVSGQPLVSDKLILAGIILSLSFCSRCTIAFSLIRKGISKLFIGQNSQRETAAFRGNFRPPWGHDLIGSVALWYQHQHACSSLGTSTR